MIPARYFPFAAPRYSLAIGATPIPPDASILEPDSLQAQELALKRDCFAARDDYYFIALPCSESAQREAALYLTAGSTPNFRHVGDTNQEDLLILDLAQPGIPLVAGHLCFPNAWSLDEKLGLSFLAIHAPVPQFETTIGPPSQKLLERLKPARPVERLNWAVKATAQLDLTTRWSSWEAEQKSLVTADNAGLRCYLRVERQTLSLLPASQSVLFTLHTYVQSIASLSPAQRELVHGVLATCPPAMLHYKGISPFLAPLLHWLTAHASVTDL